MTRVNIRTEMKFRNPSNVIHAEKEISLNEARDLTNQKFLNDEDFLSYISKLAKYNDNKEPEIIELSDMDVIIRYDPKMLKFFYVYALNNRDQSDRSRIKQFVEAKSYEAWLAAWL